MPETLRPTPEGSWWSHDYCTGSAAWTSLGRQRRRGRDRNRDHQTGRHRSPYRLCAAVLDQVTLTDADAATWRYVQAVNVESALWLAQEVIPGMAERHSAASCSSPPTPSGPRQPRRYPPTPPPH